MTDRRKWHWETIQLNNAVEKIPVPIISDAAIATVGVADGRLVPVVIVDSSSRPDIDTLVGAHKHLAPGDVKSCWSKLSKKSDRIDLLLIFIRPSRCVVLLEFDIPSRGGLVDWIIRAQGLYLQCGRKGDRLMSTMDEERMMVEVPSKAFQKEWNGIFRNVLERDFKKRGHNRSESKRLTEEFIMHWREMSSMRMKDT